MTYINLDYVETQQLRPDGSRFPNQQDCEFTPTASASAPSLSNAHELRKAGEKADEIYALERRTWPTSGAELQLRQLETQRLTTTPRHERRASAAGL